MSSSLIIFVSKESTHLLISRYLKTVFCLSDNSFETGRKTWLRMTRVRMRVTISFKRSVRRIIIDNNRYAVLREQCSTSVALISKLLPFVKVQFWVVSLGLCPVVNTFCHENVELSRKTLFYYFEHNVAPLFRDYAEICENFTNMRNL